MDRNLTQAKARRHGPATNMRAEQIFEEMLGSGFELRDVLNLSSELLSLAMIEMKKD